MDCATPAAAAGVTRSERDKSLSSIEHHNSWYCFREIAQNRKPRPPPFFKASHFIVNLELPSLAPLDVANRRSLRGDKSSCAVCSVGRLSDSPLFSTEIACVAHRRAAGRRALECLRAGAAVGLAMDAQGCMVDAMAKDIFHCETFWVGARACTPSDTCERSIRLLTASQSTETSAT